MTDAFLTRDYVGTPTSKVPGGCAYYRCWLPMSVTGAHMGIPAWDPIRGFGIMDTPSTGVFGYKTVSLKLIMDRWAPKQVEIAQSLGQRILVDLDDFYQGLTPANRAYHDSSADNNKIVNRENYEKVIANCDTLTVSTPFLLDYYKDKHPDVRMIRNGVNKNQFPYRQQGIRPVIGWAGATDWRNNDLEQLSEWLPEFLEEHDLMFHHAGHTDVAAKIEDITGINPHRVTRSPLVPITHYAAGLQFDIGLVPLNDIPFNHAKSNIKGLEYAATGIPFIATGIGEYRVLHESGIGNIAMTTDDWVNHATRLLDIKQRKQEAKRQYALLKDWTIEARAQEWIDVLKQ